MKARAGFTIIEIVLVLAVAGLIILMVFVALPALQRSQRDTARKNDISRLVSAITDYKTNNRGRAPFATSGQSRNLGAGQFVDDYLTLKASGGGTNFADPLGSEYQFVRQLDGGAGSGQILVTPGGRCDGDAPSTGGSGTGGLSSSAGLGSRSGAVRIKLEGGGQHCAEY